MSFDRVLVVGAGQMGAGIAQVVAASGREVAAPRQRSPGAVERGLEGDRGAASAKLHEKGGPEPDEVLARDHAGRRARRGRPADRGDRRERRGQEERSSAPPTRRCPRTRSSPRTRRRSRSPSSPRRRRGPERVIGMHFFNPVPDARARRGDPRRADLRRDRRGDRRAWPATSARRRPRRTTSRASSRTGS